MKNTAWINDTPTILQVAPQIIDGATFVPLRFIGEASRLEVKWYGDSQIVSLYSKQNLFFRYHAEGNLAILMRKAKIVIDYQAKFTDAYAF
ncbi:stalk domain-containing protein [Paenibacillus rhizoplanae]